jgi:hypothetical protein
MLDVHKPKPLDSEDIYNEAHNKTGIYTIYPSSNMKDISVLCDMDYVNIWRPTLTLTL